MATDEVYHYQPLSAPTTTRLIKIWPQKVNDCIACRIYYVDEKEQETIGYHALSYIWGNPDYTRHVYLSDDGNEWRRFPLHENLWLFLENAWQRRLFDQLFWTDYLCIDQKTHRELSQQVQRMHTIYSNAALVVIWLQLGEEDENNFCNYVDLSECRYKREIRYVSYQQECFDKWPGSWGLKGVLRIPYWGRIWIVQEVVVANKVWIYTSRTSIELQKLHSLFSACSWLYDEEKPSIRALWNMRAEGGEIPLWRILQDFKDYQSSHEVDRVFGILGLVQDNEDGSSPVTNITVDYEKPLSHVMLDVLFESPPPLDQLRELLLGKDKGRLISSNADLRPGITAWGTLNSYVDDARTSERHRQCARIATQVLEAFDMMLSVTRTTSSDKMALFTDLLSSAAKTGWKATRHESAALIGMMLAGGFRPQDEALIGSTGPRKGFFSYFQDSPWRCTAHGLRSPSHTNIGSYETVAFIATSSGAWNRADVLDACGDPTGGCDGSTMTYELVHIGFRIQVETAIKGGDDVLLSIQSLNWKQDNTSMSGQE